MGRNRDQSLSASTPVGFSVPGLVCVVRKHLETRHFLLSGRGTVPSAPFFRRLVTNDESLTLGFCIKVAQWVHTLPGFLLQTC